METEAESDYPTLFRREYPSVLRDVTMVMGDREAARDVTQEAFARLYANWRKVSRYERPGAWVRRVAIREAVKGKRRHARAEASAHLVSLPGGSSYTPSVHDHELTAAIAPLPPMQRAAVVLHYIHDLPVREVGDILGCREATANVHLHRARKRLAELLGEEAEDVA